MVGIIDYGAGNVESVCLLLQRLQVQFILSDQIKELEQCDALIFPGQGSAGPAMNRLRESGIDEFIKKWQKPFLGICLGMQLLGEFSEEHQTNCLGVLDYNIEKFDSSIPLIPSMGWNSIQIQKENPYFSEEESPYFYCVHSFFAKENMQTVGSTNYYGQNYSNLVIYKNFTALQAHPEKSGKVGEYFISKWLYNSGIHHQTVGKPFIPKQSGFANRIVPCLDVKAGRTVKGVNFVGLKDMGDPVELAAQYSDQGADELVFLDITATHEQRDTQQQWVSAVAKEVNIPFTVGGGIKTLDDAKRILDCGADKISVNSAAVKRPDLIAEISGLYGSQCVVLAVDYKRNSIPNSWNVFIAGGRTDTGLDAIEWISKGVELGAGELLLTGMDFDGTRQGFDLPFFQQVANNVKVPLIASGGAGKSQHFTDLFQQTTVSAGLAASIFHEGSVLIPDLKQQLREQSICVR